MARTIWKDHDRFVKTYFSTYPGLYCTGDGARRDHDNYYWVTGRVDDKMNVAGHLLSTSEIESIIVLHPNVVEAAVVAAAHPSKGHVPYAFVILRSVRSYKGRKNPHFRVKRCRKRCQTRSNKWFVKKLGRLPCHM